MCKFLHKILKDSAKFITRSLSFVKKLSGIEKYYAVSAKTPLLSIPNDVFPLQSVGGSEKIRSVVDEMWMQTGR